MPEGTGQSLRIAARLRLLYRSANRLVLAGDDELRLIDQPVAADVVEAIHHGSAVADLERDLGSRYSPAEIRGAVEKLRTDGVLNLSGGPESGADAYWDSVGCAPPAGEIAFQPLCASGSELIAQALRANGLTVSKSAPFLLVTVDDYLRPELAEISRRGQPWMLAKPVGHTIWIGPVFVPGKTACWECLAAWLKPHRWPQAAFSGWEGDAYPVQPSIATLPTTIGLAAGMIATAASVWLAQGEYPALENRVLSFDTRTLRQSFSTLRPRPHTGCKAAPADAKPASFREFVSPITGVVSEMEVTEKPAFGLYHAHALFAAPLPKGAIRDLPWLQHATGKGLTRDAAETVCVAEALERYSLIYQGSEPAIRANIRECGGISPEALLLFSEAQYRDREAWNASHSGIQWVPERFEPSEEIEWTEARSLVSGAKTYVPSGLCYMYYPFTGGRRFGSPDTNGCAAGESLTGALLGALLELIERDAVAIWWYNRLTRPAVDLASFDSPEFRALKAGFAAAGRSVHLLDITTDVGIPAYAAVAPLADGSEPCFAAAAAVSSRAAAYKAISEAAQICFWAGRKEKEGDLLTWLRSTNVRDSAYLRPCGSTAAASDPDLSPQDALDLCVRRLDAIGIDPLYVDLTRPEIGLPVIRAFAPGLRHFWARFAPGRLYSVPVSMSWLDRPHEEGEMNPTPCMI
jgi:oxazoline/thiazoline synthase